LLDITGQSAHYRTSRVQLLQVVGFRICAQEIVLQ
jgi:hypothetical protein